MDRRQHKLQQKRKKREQTKKIARIEAARRPSEEQLLVRAGARSEFGPCFVSAGWDDESEPALVSVIVTRRLDADELLVHMLLLDRTCLGVKNAMLSPPMTRDGVEEFAEDVGRAHGGMEKCEPLLAQSLVFHALDYARELGFTPNADFHESLLGPRPETLLETPWRRAERPLYISGPDDNVGRIMAQLQRAAGASVMLADPLEIVAQLEDGEVLEDGGD